MVEVKSLICEGSKATSSSKGHVTEGLNMPLSKRGGGFVFGSQLANTILFVTNYVFQGISITRRGSGTLFTCPSVSAGLVRQYALLQYAPHRVAGLRRS